MQSSIAHRVIGPEDGERVDLLALGVRFLVGGDETDGRFSLVEHPLPARALGSPVHTHHHEDEYSFVLEGRVGVQLGDDTMVAGPGELVVKPRGVPHAFWNAGDEPARLLEMISPAGFEDYFREMAPLLAAEERDAAAVAVVADRYGLANYFGTVPGLIEAHGLRPR